MKKVKNKKNYKNLLPGGVIIMVVLLGLFIVMEFHLDKTGRQVNLNTNVTQPMSRTYHSDLLSITVDIPEDFAFKEETPLREIILEKDGGLINIHRFSTNRHYNNIKELQDEIYNSDSSPKEITRQQTKISDKDCETSILKYTNSPESNTKSYDCYINGNSFLSISTTSQKLYPDLDKIVRLIHYDPERKSWE